MNHRWTEGDRAALRAGGTALDEALADMVPVYFDWYEPELGVREIPLHDPLAAAIAVGDLTPSDAPQLPLRVDPGGAIREDPSATSAVRVVFALEQPGGPAILHRLLTRNQ
jgi:purine nucleosidase